MVWYKIITTISWKICRLNPCCSGRWSGTIVLTNVPKGAPKVLILVVVDDGLVLKYGLNAILMQFGVLILVVVDNGLVLLL